MARYVTWFWIVLIFASQLDHPFATHQFRLQRLVDHEMDDSLWNAKVAGRDALVEALQPGLVVNVGHTPAHWQPLAPLMVQLQPRLHEPNRVGHGGRHKSRTRRTQDVHDGRVAGDVTEEEEEDNNYIMILFITVKSGY